MSCLHGNNEIINLQSVPPRDTRKERFRMEKIKVLLVEPMKQTRVVEVENTLEAKQKIVGGLIQHVSLGSDEAAIICNDEGKLLGLKPNRPLLYNEQIYDIVCGTFLIVGAPADSDTYSSLPDSLIEKYSSLYNSLLIIS